MSTFDQELDTTAERRAFILAGAMLLFADRGFHGVSVDEDASMMGWGHLANEEMCDLAHRTMRYP